MPEELRQAQHECRVRHGEHLSSTAPMTLPRSAPMKRAPSGQQPLSFLHSVEFGFRLPGINDDRCPDRPDRPDDFHGVHVDVCVKGVDAVRCNRVQTDLGLARLAATHGQEAQAARPRRRRALGGQPAGPTPVLGSALADGRHERRGRVRRRGWEALAGRQRGPIAHAIAHGNRVRTGNSRTRTAINGQGRGLLRVQAAAVDAQRRPTVT